MIERLALLLLVGFLAVAAFYALRVAHMRRMRPSVESGLPSLLYFRGDSCAVCPTQTRFVDQLAAQWDGRLRVERIDAERDADTALRYRVFTLPTTVLVDRNGKVQHINYGLTDAQKLERQLSALLARNPERPASVVGNTSIQSAPSAD